MRLSFVTMLWAALMLFVGCEKTPGPPEEENPEEGEGNGNFVVDLKRPTGTAAGYTSLIGKVFDGPPISPVIWENSSTQGDCEVITPRYPFCDIPCSGGEICVEDNTCAAYPGVITVGNVTVRGILTTEGQTEFEIAPVANNYQLTGGLAIEYPGFAEGDAISLTAAGEPSLAGFRVETKGISPLEVVAGDITLADGQEIVLEWAPAGETGISTIEVEVDISHHGGVKGKIICEAPDTGTLIIDSDLVDQLKALGISGFPKLVMTRISKGTHTEAGVNLIVKSQVDKELIIPGLISCFEDEECPDGQTCQQDARCE